MRPTLSDVLSGNHRAPSGPVTMSSGLPLPPPTGYMVMFPEVVIRPTCGGLDGMVNHNAPSGPVVMPHKPDEGKPGMEYSVITPAVVMRPILPKLPSVNHRA